MGTEGSIFNRRPSKYTNLFPPTPAPSSNCMRQAYADMMKPWFSIVWTYVWVINSVIQTKIKSSCISTPD
jgi:hypothetical protein